MASFESAARSRSLNTGRSRVSVTLKRGFKTLVEPLLIFFSKSAFYFLILTLCGGGRASGEVEFGGFVKGVSDTTASVSLQNLRR